MLRVLVVEDDPDLVLIMQHELALAGHDVSFAVRADDAVRMAADVDIVLLDFHLPDADGLEILAKIQGLASAPSVVMVTGDDLGGLEREAMRGGAVEFVPKRPGYLRALPGIVERAARQHDLTRRVADLESVSLGLLAADTPDSAISEILAGACRLLNGRSASLLRIEDEKAVLVAQTGGVTSDMQTVQGMPLLELPGAGQAMKLGDASLVVCLPSTISDRQHFLVVGEMSSARRREIDDLALARAYGRVAGTALRSAERRLSQVQLLEAVKQAALDRAQQHDHLSHSIGDQLDRALLELTTLLDSPDIAAPWVRSLARAEAHVVAARDAAQQLDHRRTGRPSLDE